MMLGLQGLQLHAEEEKSALQVIGQVAATPVAGATQAVSTSHSKRDPIAKTLQKAAKRFFADAFSEESSFFYLLLMAFCAGLLVSLTPCIYPMIPVTASVLSGGTGSILRHLGRSIAYVLGIATIYSGLGYLSATSGMVFGQWMSNPWLVGLLVLFFLYLAFAMFGFYEIRGFTLIKQGTVGRGVFSVYLFGLLSGTAASPCLTPPLAMLLGLVAKLGNPVVGVLLLFAFALGLSTVLILIGTFAGSLAALPKPGTWMFEIQRIFGFAILFAIIHFINPFFPAWAILLMLGTLCAIIAAYYFISSRNEAVLELMRLGREKGGEVHGARSGFHGLTFRVLFKKLAAIVTLVLAVYFLINGLLGYYHTTMLKVIIRLLT